MVCYNSSCSSISFNVDSNLFKNYATNSLNHLACILNNLPIEDNIESILKTREIDNYHIERYLSYLENPEKSINLLTTSYSKINYVTSLKLDLELLEIESQLKNR